MKVLKHVLPIFMAMMVLLGCQALKGASKSRELIKMMSMVPAEVGAVSQSGWLIIRYADIRANEQARPGVPAPVDFAAFEALDDHEREMWNANSYRLVSIAEDIYSPLLYDAELVKYYGLDYFEIDRSLEYISVESKGETRQYGVIYGGHFDTDQIAATLTARAYTTTELNGMTVLCGPVGCEHGDKTGNLMPDQGKRDPATFKAAGQYPFLDVNLGRQQPLALLPGYLLSTPIWEQLDAMTAAAKDKEKSLYDVREYRAVANFAVTDGSLIQVYFFPPSYFAPPDKLHEALKLTYFAGEEASLDDWAELRAKLGLDNDGRPLYVEDLPKYSLGALVDRQEGDEQVHSIVLVYGQEQDAQQAAAEVVKRIPLQSSYLWRNEDKPLIDYAVSEYTLESPQVIHDRDAGRWLAVATVRVLMSNNNPFDDPFPGADNISHSGRLLAVWYRSLTMGDFTPVLLTRE